MASNGLAKKDEAKAASESSLSVAFAVQDCKVGVPS